MNDCILCGHPQRDHHGDGCHGRSLSTTCHCAYVEQAPLAQDVDAAAHRARSDWWDRQARVAWELALRSRHDLHRWYSLMRFHRVARRAEIDHRRFAESLTRSATLNVAPIQAPAPLAVVPLARPRPAISLAPRTEPAAVA